MLVSQVFKHIDSTPNAQVAMTEFRLNLFNYQSLVNNKTHLRYITKL